MAAVAALLAAGPDTAPEITPRRAGAAAVERGRLLPGSSANSDAGIELAEFALRKASLDEVFLALTGQRHHGRQADETAA